MEQAPVSVPIGLDRRALRDQVHDRILDLLLKGDLPPNERLSMDTLSRDLNVSPTPVREALVELERTGLVVRQALKGYRVAPPLQADQIAELFEARLVVETGAARLAEQHAEGLVDELREAHRHHSATAERLADAQAKGMVDLALVHDYFDADWAFHRVIHEHAHNRFLEQMATSLGTQLHRMRQTMSHGMDSELALAEHESILAAFASERPGRGEEAIRDHLAAVRARAIQDA